MKKTLIPIFTVLFLAGTACAEQTGVKSWFEGVLKSLKAETVSRFGSKAVRMTAVASVRGADMSSDPMELYWKGGLTEASEKAMAVEKKDFTEAAQLVLDGKNDEGFAALNAFKKNHPDSSLLPDVNEAMEKLQPEIKKEEPAKPDEKKDASKKEEPAKPEEKDK